MNFLTTLFLFFFNPFILIIFSIITVCIYPFDKNGNIIRKIVKKYLFIYSKFTGLNITSKGIDKIKTDKNYFILANFNDITDIFAILHSLPNPNVLCILRYHNFFIPFVSIIFRSCKYIKFRRNKIGEFIQTTISSLNNGLSVLHFPAGYSNLLESDFIYHNFLTIYKKSNCEILPVKIIHDETNSIIIEYRDPIHGTFDDLELKKMVINSIKK